MLAQQQHQHRTGNQQTEITLFVCECIYELYKSIQNSRLAGPKCTGRCTQRGARSKSPGNKARGRIQKREKRKKRKYVGEKLWWKRLEKPICFAETPEIEARLPASRLIPDNLKNWGEHILFFFTFRFTLWIWFLIQRLKVNSYLSFSFAFPFYNLQDSHSIFSLLL